MTGSKNVTQTMEDILQDALAPTQLIIKNQSHLHAGHMGDDGSGESHFKLIIRSPAFKGLTRLEKQRHVYQLLAPLLKTQIHALSLDLGE